MMVGLLKILFFIIINLLLFLQYKRIDNTQIFQAFLLFYIVFASFVYFCTSRLGIIFTRLAESESTADILFSAAALTTKEQDLFRKYSLTNDSDTAKQLLTSRSLNNFNFHNKSFSNEELDAMVQFAMNVPDSNDK